MSSPTLSRTVSQKSFVPFLIAGLLALCFAIGALPRYMGDWPWASNPTVPNKSALIAVKEGGLPIPGWQTQEQATIKLGGETWSIQQLAAAPETRQAIAPESPADIFLLLRSQVWHADQPEVEWVDIQGSQNWKVDSRQKLSFSVPSPSQGKQPTSPVKVTGDFLRARNQDQTYAVLQWYAWPTGGSPSPAKWFWKDQISQLQRNQRTPWVAVSLWLPIKPFSDISKQQAMADSLGKTIQATLLESVFIDTEAS